MRRVFDVLEAIRERVLEHLYNTGVKGTHIALSPGAYRRLLEIRRSRDGVPVAAGCAAISEIMTPVGRLSVLIDELIPDTEIEVLSLNETG
ncbi:MAG: hypothetical protein KAJ12_01475 [Bacteroidetes bacterium]|nr:hypothetical protein [Bacteroidota bacterium]